MPGQTGIERMQDTGRVAVILPPTGGDWAFASQQLAGLSIFVRVILTALRGEVSRFLILGAGSHKSQLQALLADRALGVPLSWSDEGTGEGGVRSQIRAPFFLISASTLFAPAVLNTLRGAWDEGTERVVPVRPNGGGSEERPGIALVSPTGGGHRVHRCPIPAETLYLDATTLPLTEAERRLGAALTKPTYNWYTRLCRRLLTPLVLQLSRTPLTPLQLTFAWFGVTLVGSLLLYRGTYPLSVIGTFLCVVSHQMDLLDGMLARLKFLESPRGAKIDLFFGFARSLILLIALTAAVAASGKDVFIPGSLLIGGSLVATPLVFFARSGSPAARWLAETLGHGDWILVLFLCALLNRLNWFLWAAAVGANLYWLSLLAVLICVEKKREPVG